MLESLFNKFLIKSCEYCEISKKTFFEEHLRTAASESPNKALLSTKLSNDLSIKVNVLRIILLQCFLQALPHH